MLISFSLETQTHEMTNKMKTLLIFPPNFSIDQPYLSIPMLVSFLKQKGIKNVVQFDANIDSFHWFMRKQFLKQCYTKIKSERLQISKSWQKMSVFDRGKYQLLCEATLYFPCVLENILKAKNYFKALKKTSIHEYNFYKNVIDKAFKILSAAYYPTEVTIRNFSMRFSNQSFSEILKAMNSTENPYIDYFDNILIKRIIQSNPALIGFSITTLSQIIPSFTFAFFVKKHFPEKKIVFGGQVFNRLQNNILKIPKIFTFIDYLIVNEGETALLQLIRYLKKEITIDEVPNIYYETKSKIKKTNKVFKENIENLQIPEFDTLTLSKYLAPKPVLQYQPTRGCYWHKCKFCNQFLIYGTGMRCKDIKEIVSDLKYLKSKYKTPYFALINESIAPSILRNIAQGLLGANLKIRWYAGARFDKKFDRKTLEILKRSGCEKLYFGLESGSQKILNDMNKGTKFQNIIKILQNCKEVGIGVHLFIMIGFPTETRKDLEVSKKSIIESLKYVDKDSFSYYISIYQLKPETYLFEHPNEFNIRDVYRKEEYDLEYLYEFDKENLESNIDFEQERKDIEKRIDKIIGEKNFPENIVHYINFKSIFEGKRKKVPKINSKVNMRDNGTVFCIDPLLSFGCFRHYDLQCHKSNFLTEGSNSHLIYNIWNDSIYEIPNKSLWMILQTTNQPFKISEFNKLLQQEFYVGKSDMNLVRSFATDLINNEIIINLKKEI